MKALIRPALPTDIPAVASIYAHEVAHGTATFDLEPPDEAGMAARLDHLVRRGFPYLVAQADGAVVGFGYAGPHRARPAYRFTVEDSIYIHPLAQRRGVGKALLARLIAEATIAGFRQMVAVIGGSANAASQRLHSALGFRTVGAFNDVGWKHGRWLDAVLMQRPLGDGAERPPMLLPERPGARKSPDPNAVYHLLYLERVTLVVKRPSAGWRELQDEFEDYKTSLGPWPLDAVAAFLREEYGADPETESRLAGFAGSRATVISL